MSAKIVTSLLMSAATLAGCGEVPVAPSGHLGDPSLSAALAPTDGLAGQLIAFASDRDGTGFQVFLMQANGPKQTQLTHVPGYNARPNWSHDGRRITFTTCRPTDFSCDIYVMNADGSAQTNLTHDFSTDQMSVWSPDDRRIAFVSDRDGTPQIYVMNADGSNVTRLTFDGAFDFLPTWSPDGTRLALQTSRDGNDEVYVMNANGSNPVNLTNNPSTDGFPAWSPRGDKIAFRSDRDGNGEIYVMNVDGSRQTNLTHNPAEEYYPAWSPTGGQIAFVSDRDGNFEIYGMKPDGSLQTRLTSNPAFDADPAWAIAVTTGPAASPGPCPAAPTRTVSDEAGFRNAIVTAVPGAVIAIQGMIGLTQDDTIRTVGVTITCATPGSGLFAVAGGGAQDMLTVDARKVTVDHLVLDAGQAAEGPYLSENDGVTAFAESTTFTNNIVTCPPNGVCALVAGGIGAVVSDNRFQALGPFTGIQLQTNGADGEIRIDGARVERNTLVATAPATGPRQGAIRPFDVVNLVIADNTAIGPWRAGVSATRLASSRVSGNTFQGAFQYGIETSNLSPALDPGRVTSTLFSGNRIGEAGLAGVFAHLACSNAFIGNDLEATPGNVGLLFDVASGANTYAGDRSVVVDNGAFDCNGDGTNDPNIMSGPGMPRHGLQLGGAVSGTDPVRMVRGIPVK